MTDVKALTDVELTELWLSKVKGYPDTREVIQAIDYEMRERGAERVRTAWHEVSAKREAAQAEREERIGFSEYIWSGDDEVSP